MLEAPLESLSASNKITCRYALMMMFSFVGALFLFGARTRVRLPLHENPSTFSRSSLRYICCCLYIYKFKFYYVINVLSILYARAQWLCISLCISLKVARGNWIFILYDTWEYCLAYFQEAGCLLISFCLSFLKSM